jgi:uncharacterized membrane protein YhhN
MPAASAMASSRRAPCWPAATASSACSAAAAIGAGTRYPLIRWGALLFVLSDSLIGIFRFRGPVPLGEYLVWGTHYVAQCCLALGVFRGHLRG